VFKEVTEEGLLDLSLGVGLVARAGSAALIFPAFYGHGGFAGACHRALPTLWSFGHDFSMRVGSRDWIGVNTQ